ncbi:MAG: PEP-CTERM sorting domain-containing protein [Verrucomicrobiota bacterium]
MRTLFILFMVVIALAGTLTRAYSATLILDSFSEGDFLLQDGGDESDEIAISSPVVDSREVLGFGQGTWSIAMVAGNGSLDYFVTEILGTPGSPRFGMIFQYESMPSASLLGFDAFSFDFTGVTGTALLEIFVNNQNAAAMMPVTLDSSGQLVYPFANLAANDLSAISNISFRVIPQSDTFSFSLNEVSIVPEPSAFIFLLLGGAGVFRRRRG